MHRVALVPTVVVAFLLALPLPAIAGQPQSQAEHTVTGTVVYADPVAFAVDTGSTIETFRIPPGADWAGQIVPNARVTLNWKAVPVESGRAVVRVEPARAAAPRVVTTDSVVGHVAFIDPAEMAVRTAKGIDVLTFAPGAPRPQGLVAGDDVRVWYKVEPEANRGAVAHTALRDHAAARPATRVASQAGALHTVTGEVAMITPDTLVVDTGKRLQEFAINRASKIGDVVRGDDVRIRYERVASASGQPVIVSYPDLLHSTS